MTDFNPRNLIRPPPKSKIDNIRTAKLRDMLAYEDASCGNCLWFRERGSMCAIGEDLCGLVQTTAEKCCNHWTKP